MDQSYFYTFMAGLCNFMHGATLKSVCRFVETLVMASAARTWLIAGMLAERERIRFKSALQAVSRVLGNAKVDMWRLGARLLERITEEGERVIVALDWTEWTSDKRALVAAVMVGKRGIPIAAEGFDRTNIFRSQNAWENTFLRMLKSLVCEARREVVLVADRGFRRASFMRELQCLKMDFVVRLMVKAMVYRPGAAKGYLLSRLQLRPGQIRDLGIVELKADRRVRVRIVALWAKGQREPWWLATSLTLDAEEVASLYDRRMAVEQQFRDTKGFRYGVEVIWNQFEQPERIGRLFVYVGIALAIWTAIGHEIAERDPTARLMHPTKGARRSFATIGRHAMKVVTHFVNVTAQWLRTHIPKPELRPMGLGLKFVRTRFTVSTRGVS